MSEDARNSFYELSREYNEAADQADYWRGLATKIENGDAVKGHFSFQGGGHMALSSVPGWQEIIVAAVQARAVEAETVAREKGQRVKDMIDSETHPAA